ncbi:hypothetical protein Rs2_16032 [Raphanus sativus]|nr:hypothetical protein Rs2_16032 [Raphanus sativus]
MNRLNSDDRRRLLSPLCAVVSSLPSAQFVVVCTSTSSSILDQSSLLNVRLLLLLKALLDGVFAKQHLDRISPPLFFPEAGWCLSSIPSWVPCGVGTREKELLAENDALRRFKSHKK